MPNRKAIRKGGVREIEYLFHQAEKKCRSTLRMTKINGMEAPCFSLTDYLVSLILSPLAETGIVVKTISVTDLKANLSRCLKWLKTGDPILILDRGVPFARIDPLTWATAPQESMEAIMQQLVAEGLVKPPSSPGGRTKKL